MPFRTKLGMSVPILWKLPRTICHVLTAKHPQFEHLLGSKVGLKLGRKALARRLRQFVSVALLHLVIHYNSFLSHLEIK